MHYKALIEGKRKMILKIKLIGYRFWDDVPKISNVLEYIRSNKSIIESIELSSNSLSLDASKALRQEISNIENLKIVNYRDIFVSRKKDDLPDSLKELMLAIENKKIEILDLSDNAFGPIGVKAFDFFILKTESLRELYLENNGLGPEGAESLADSLLKNDQIKLRTLLINRNRLENKGAIAFSKYILYYILLYFNLIYNFLHILEY
jgi:Ran GTPase-activating protein (RanGAP) involved in mRNA processing and transport